MEVGRKAGSGIGRLGAILADLAPDAVPWEVVLRGPLARALTERARPNWRRPSGSFVARLAEAERRGGSLPVFEPGRQRTNHRPTIVIGLDTSASIDAQTLRLFWAEAEGIARRTGAEVHLLVFDEKVGQTIRLDPIGRRGRMDHQVRTGGGTDFTDLFDKSARLHPSILIVLTDLDAPIPAVPKFPVLWAVPQSVETPPFGKLLLIGDS